MRCATAVMAALVMAAGSLGAEGADNDSNLLSMAPLVPQPDRMETLVLPWQVCQDTCFDIYCTTPRVLLAPENRAAKPEGWVFNANSCASMAVAEAAFAGHLARGAGRAGAGLGTETPGFGNTLAGGPLDAGSYPDDLPDEFWWGKYLSCLKSCAQ